MVASIRPLAAILGLVLLAACADGGIQATFKPGAEDAPPAAADNADLFQFAAPRLGGGSQVTGAELQGKDVALWFWAPW